MGHGGVIGAAQRGGASAPARAVPSAPPGAPTMASNMAGNAGPERPNGAPGLARNANPAPRQNPQPGAQRPAQQIARQVVQPAVQPALQQPVQPHPQRQPGLPLALQLKPRLHGRPAAPSGMPAGAAPRAPAALPRAPAVLQAKAALQARSASGQTRIYPNLRPLAQQNAPNEEIFSLQQWYGNYGLRGTGGRGHYVPNARYLFVRTTDGQTLMHPRLRHPVLASGEPVMYAGEAYFESGALRWWSNGSGHYRPDSDHAPQAGLPLDKFRTWDDVVRRGTRAPPQASS